MRFVWKCDRGHVVVKRGAVRKEYRHETRSFVFCQVCKTIKPLSREMQKGAPPC